MFKGRHGENRLGAGVIKSVTSRAVGSLRHGDQFPMTALGIVNTVSASSALSSNCGYAVPFKRITQGASLLLLMEEFYGVLERVNESSHVFVFPLRLAGILFQSQEPVSQTFDEMSLLRLLTGQLDQDQPVGVCLRGEENAQEPCVFQLISSSASIVQLERAMTQCMDFSYMLWEKSLLQQSGGTPENLARAVESHRF